MLGHIFHRSWFFYIFVVIIIMGSVNFPFWDRLHVGQTGENYASSKSPIEGVIYFEMMTIIYPGSPRYYLALSKANYAIGNHLAAFRAFKRAVSLDPHNGPSNMQGFKAFIKS